jgi:hypothetical protein
MLNLDSSPVFGDANLGSTRLTPPLPGQGAGGNLTFSLNGELSPAVIGQ